MRTRLLHIAIGTLLLIVAGAPAWAGGGKLSASGAVQFVDDPGPLSLDEGDRLRVSVKLAEASVDGDAEVFSVKKIKVRVGGEKFRARREGNPELRVGQTARAFDLSLSSQPGRLPSSGGAITLSVLGQGSLTDFSRGDTSAHGTLILSTADGTADVRIELDDLRLGGKARGRRGGGAAAVPEPGTAGLLALGLSALAFVGRRRA